VTGLLAGMTPAPPDQQALVENEPPAEKGALGYRCYTFSSLDQRRTVVAFWNAKPWEANITTSSAVITLPPAMKTGHLLLYNLLSGEQTELPAKWSEDRRLSVPVSFSGAPLLIVR
jgi:hypothetical protein